MSTAEATRYTPDDLLTMDSDALYELVDGGLVEKSMSVLASLTAAKLIGKVGTYLESNPRGIPAEAQCSYQCFPDDPLKVRRPDFSFIANGRLPQGQVERGHVRIAPDLAAEVVSPNDLFYEVADKVKEYLQAGVQVVWIIDPEHRTITTHRSDRSTTTLQEGDGLTEEKLLPGFRCAVSDLFPTPEQLKALTGE